MASRTSLLIDSSITHHAATVHLTVDRRHNRVRVLVVEADESKHRYEVVPHPTEAGNIALMEV